MNDKYLLLVSDKDSHFFYCLKNANFYSLYNIYRKMSIFDRVRRKIMILIGMDIQTFYDTWKNDNNSYTKIIIEDGTLDDRIILYLRRKFPNAQLIYWFRNSFGAVDYGKSRDLHFRHASMCDKVISFDKKDALLYGYEYMENAYARDDSLLPTELKFDMIYLGSEKNRLESILKVVNYTNSLGWNNYIYIFSKNHKDNKFTHKSFLPYKDYLKIMNQSKVILDIVDISYQNGYSLRIFESLFYKKKLITNMKIIRKEPFYHPNNIYIIDLNDVNSYEGLNNFMQLPFFPISESILDSFDFKNWIKRI